MAPSSEPVQRDASRPSRLRVAVVSHTHWDREWYHPAERFRQRLVALVDAILDDPGPVPFLLDGQAIVLDDYLRVRPEAFTRLADALQRGVIEAGPWYVLADNQIPGGEALIRNLEAGRRMMHRFGAVAPAVLYCPDTFGHPAAMPLLAHGFGLPVAVAWRGIGGVGHPTQDAFVWMAPSGERVVVHHLPPDGYEFGSALPLDEAAVRARWAKLQSLLAPRSATGIVLLLNGADHHARQPDLERRLAMLAEVAAPEAEVVPQSLTQWGEAFATAAQQTALPVVTGALRNSYGYTWTLSGTLATRAHQKRTNAILERTLLRDVEPWLALLRLQRTTLSVPDTAARVKMAQLPALLHRAWEDLLATHPHDTLCGCSVDAVARAMTQRQEAVHAQLPGLRESALQGLLRHDPVAARERAVRREGAPVVIRNRTARPRHGIARVVVMDTLADVAVGPGSAANASPNAAPPATAQWIHSGWITQELGTRITYHRRESSQHYPDNDLVVERQLLTWSPPVDAFGLRVMSLEAPPPQAASWTPVSVRIDGEQILCANDHLTVRVEHAETSPTVTIIAGDRRIDDACWIETRPDAGDSYTPAPRGVATRLRAVRAWVTHRGPLRSTVRIAWRAADASRTVGPRGDIRVVTDLEIDAESPVVRCRMRGTNRRIDHRLQFVWRTDQSEHATVTADAAFGPVVREPITLPVDTHESVPPGMPIHRWLCTSEQGRAATLLSDGLAEAEPAPHRLALTLLRSTGALSRNDLPERPGHAGWPAAIPEAQCLGAFRAVCGLMLHKAAADGAVDGAALEAISAAADDLLAPLVGASWRDLTTDIHEVSGIALTGRGLEVSAITLSAVDPSAILLRAVNLASEPADGTWTMPDDGPWDITPCRFDETPIGATEQRRGTIPFRASARGVVTLRVQRARAESVADEGRG